MAGAGPPYAAALVVGVAEAEGDASDVFDDAVVALGAGVGQPGLQGGDDGCLPGFDGAGESDDLGYFAGSSKLTGQVLGGESGAGPLGAGAVEAYPAA